MAIIRLIRGLSYMDGHINVTMEKPEVNVDDAKVAHYVGTGFFEVVSVGASAEDSVSEAAEDADAAEETGKESDLADIPDEGNPVDGMTVAELKEYAENNGIVISGLTKKAEIIDAIKEAEKRAAEARELLRQE